MTAYVVTGSRDVASRKTPLCGCRPTGVSGPEGVQVDGEALLLVNTQESLAPTLYRV